MKKNVLMTLLCGLFMIPSLAIAQPSDVKDEKKCTASFSILDKEIWTLTIEDDRIAGSNSVVNLEDNVMFGFIGGKAVRLKFKEDQIDGSIGGKSAMLVLERGAEFTTIRGPLGKSHMVAIASADHLELSGGMLTLKLNRVGKSNRVLMNEHGDVRLVFEGCDHTIVAARPELVVIMQQLLTSRVEMFEDISQSIRAGISEAAARTQSAPSPSGRRVPPKPSK
ncbi:MAG: hypothetical protein JRJ87_11970 [Deltaproteobacteria bacterium]|nr:hypothetical protein [Deltaproteobacteria bacterium]